MINPTRKQTMWLARIKAGDVRRAIFGVGRRETYSYSAVSSGRAPSERTVLDLENAGWIEWCNAVACLTQTGKEAIA